MLEPKCLNKSAKFCQILILTLWFVTLPCFLAKIAEILQIVIVFFSGKGRGDRVLILTYLDSQIADVFPHLCLSFSILGILREKLVVNFANFWSISFLWKLESFKFCLMFLLPRVLPMVRISATLDHIWGSKGPKSSHKWSFYGCLLGT